MLHSLRIRQQTGFAEQGRPQLPYLMLGHSMGSFVLRNYLCRYGEGLSGARDHGTGMQPETLLKTSLRLVRILTALQGEKTQKRAGECAGLWRL